MPTKWTPNDLLKYDWLHELINWKFRKAEGETRYWSLSQQSSGSVKCHLGWTTVDYTTYRVDKAARSPEHAVSLALEAFDTWRANKIKQEQANGNSTEFNRNGSQGAEKPEESPRQAK